MIVILWSLAVKKFYFTLFVFFLVGCATLSYDEILAGYKQHCQNVGFKNGTEAWANCVMEQYKIAK